MGSPARATWWKRNLPALSSAFRVTAIDLPGFGSSHPDARLILDEVPAQVAALLGELGIERAHVMGHSMGGLVAAGLAADHPERVDRLVLVDAGFLSLDPTLAAPRHRPLRTLPWTSLTHPPDPAARRASFGPRSGWPGPPPRCCARTGATSCRPSRRRRSSSGVSTIASAPCASASRSRRPCPAPGW